MRADWRKPMASVQPINATIISAGSPAPSGTKRAGSASARCWTNCSVVFDLFARLRERQHQAAGTLSGGEQQMVAIGRAMMGRPQLLMLDEPSMGLAPLVTAEIFRLISRLQREMGISVLLVEQNARAALRMSDRAYVLSLVRRFLQRWPGILKRQPMTLSTPICQNHD